MRQARAHAVAHVGFLRPQLTRFAGCRTQCYTPDFLVRRTTGVELIEVKYGLRHRCRLLDNAKRLLPLRVAPARCKDGEACANPCTRSGTPHLPYAPHHAPRPKPRACNNLAPVVARGILYVDLSVPINGQGSARAVLSMPRACADVA